MTLIRELPRIFFNITAEISRDSQYAVIPVSTIRMVTSGF